MRAYELAPRSSADPLFELPPDLEAHEPAEARGLRRDAVRLLISTTRGHTHARFSKLAEFLKPEDLLVLNTSATIPAAVGAYRSDGSRLLLHASTRLPSDLFIVEPRNGKVAREALRLNGGGLVEILTPYKNSQRLWIARLSLPMKFTAYLNRYGAPIQYRHSARVWPMDVYQNVYATEPGSSEMPSAGRPFTCELLEGLRGKGIRTAAIVLHAGVSSLERNEEPHEEWFEVPVQTAAAIERARERGGRIVAIGTTVVRALESALDENGQVVAARGWTDLVVTPTRGAYAVDALITGFHEPNSSHLALLEAIVGPNRVRDSYREALDARYLWHEFGDSHLIFS